VHSHRFTTVLGVVTLAFLGSIVLFAQGNAAAAAMKNPVAASAESVAAGQDTYRKSCAPCHGIKAEGGSGNDLIPESPDLTDEVWDHGSTDGAIFDNIKNGVPPNFNMTPWKDQLKDDQIWNVVNYLRSIAKKK
jgi:mono/diheme cytochrome c family protein